MTKWVDIFDDFNAEEQRYFFYKAFSFGAIDTIEVWKRLNKEVFNGQADKKLAFRTRSDIGITAIEGEALTLEEHKKALLIVREEQESHNGKVEFFMNGNNKDFFDKVDQIRQRLDSSHIDKHLIMVRAKFSVVKFVIGGLSENAIKRVKRILKDEFKIKSVY